MYGERLAAAMSRAVVTILWRAALPWRRVLRQLPQPAVMVGAAVGAAAGALALLLNRIRPLFMAKAGITAVTRRVRATETVTIIGKCFASPGMT